LEVKGCISGLLSAQHCFTLCFYLLLLFAEDHSAQVVSFSEGTDEVLAIELTGQKVITEDFSFKMPKDWGGSCLLIPEDSGYGIYSKAAYEEDGSGLLFTIACYEDVDYKDLQGCSILGFCENRTYILESHYDEYFEDSSDAGYKTCEEASRLLKKSFVSYIKEPAV